MSILPKKYLAKLQPGFTRAVFYTKNIAKFVQIGENYLDNTYKSN